MGTTESWLESVLPIADPASLAEMVYAGNIRLTLVNGATGSHITFKVWKPKKQKDPAKPWYKVAAKVNLDPTDNSGWEIYGWLTHEKRFAKARFTQLPDTLPVAKGIRWFFAHLSTGQPFPADLRFYRSVSCCCCGKALDVEDSIKDGIGPDCKEILTKRGVDWSTWVK